MKKLLLLLLLVVSIYPIQYFLNSSLNYLPIQVLAITAILIFYGRLTIDKRHNFLYMLFAIYVIFIVIYNISNPYSIITNPILVTFLVMLLILLLHKNDISKDSINITLGLPFIRISPDHGPNNTMLGKNKSNPQSLIKALEFLDR